MPENEIKIPSFAFGDKPFIDHNYGQIVYAKNAITPPFFSKETGRMVSMVVARRLNWSPDVMIPVVEAIDKSELPEHTVPVDTMVIEIARFHAQDGLRSVMTQDNMFEYIEGIYKRVTTKRIEFDGDDSMSGKLLIVAQKSEMYYSMTHFRLIFGTLEKMTATDPFFSKIAGMLTVINVIGKFWLDETIIDSMKEIVENLQLPDSITDIDHAILAFQRYVYGLDKNRRDLAHQHLDTLLEEEILLDLFGLPEEEPKPHQTGGDEYGSN